MQDSNSDMTMNIQWTDMDKETLGKQEVIIFKQNIVEREMKNTELPTDIHLIDYTRGGQSYTDAVRAAKMSVIFDVYHDKLRSMDHADIVGSVTRIRNGFGTIKPILYNIEKKQTEKK